MKIPDPWKCDECGGNKTPTNHWFLGLPQSLFAVGVLHEKFKGSAVVEWHDKLAEMEGVKHICGIECAQKYSGKELAKVYGNEVGPGKSL